MHGSTQMAEIVGGIVTLLLLGSALLAACKRLKLPFTVVLVVAGMVLSWLAGISSGALQILQQLRISPDLIFYIFLPTLVFEASFHLDTRQLRRDLAAVMTLAVPGLLLSTALVGAIVAVATSIPLPAALLLGAVLSATDPVAVIALFHEVGAPKRLTVLVEGESLLNDATSVVMARILVGFVAAGAMSAPIIGAGIVDFLLLFAGGLAVGCVLGLVAGYALGKVESDPFIEITLTTILAYLSFILAEELLGVSGIMATIGAGLVLGGWGRTKVSASVRNFLDHFWMYLAFVANALIFLMVGLRVDLAALWKVLDLLPWVILAVIVARAVVVFGLMPLSERLYRPEPVDLPYRTIMFWGGLRGAIALALVLSLPASEYTDTFVALVMGVVLFTLLVQGLSIRWLIGLLGLGRVPLADRLAWLDADLNSRRRALERIDRLVEGGLFSDRLAAVLREECLSSIQRSRREIEELRQTELDRDQERRLLYLRGFAVERSLFMELFNQGHLSEGAFRELLHLLTLEVDSIRYQGRFQPAHLKSLRRRKWVGGLVQAVSRIPGCALLAERWRMARVARDFEEAWGRYQGCSWVLQRLEDLARLANLPPEVESEVRQQYTDWLETARRQVDETAEQFPEFFSAMQQRLGRRLLLLAELESTAGQAELGLLPQGAAEHHAVDVARRLRRLRGQEIGALKIEPAELLRKLPLFQQLPPEGFASLAVRLVARTVSREEEVIRQGETGKSMYFIARGVMCVIHEDESGAQDLGRMLAGDFFGEIALLHDVRRTATVKAVTPGVLYELRRDDVEEAMAAHPAVRQALELADRKRISGREGL